MSFMQELHDFFGTKDLYQVLELDKGSVESEIKKSFRKLSLKYHPDRFAAQELDDAKKEQITKRFQALAKVHFILTNDEKRKVYDESGVILDEDNLDNEANWADYWRLLFPKITTKHIEEFTAKYIGSDEEKEDLKKYYLKYEGDMDKVFESVIGFDEDRTREMLLKMIEDDEVPEFDSFVNEPAIKRERRQKKVVKEKKLADKESKKRELDESQEDLSKVILAKNRSNFNSMIAALESKYAKETKKKGKRSKK